MSFVGDGGCWLLNINVTQLMLTEELACDLEISLTQPNKHIFCKTKLSLKLSTIIILTLVK